MSGFKLQSLLLVLLLAFITRCYGLESLDVFEPIVKISPANVTDDSFGYSVTAHQLFQDSTNMTLEQIYEQTMIMVGAPRGAYPGGLNVPPDANICQGVHSNLSSLTEEQITACYYNQNIGRNNITGLIYQCSLSSESCGAALGNGNASSPDGLLFDRVGDVKIYNPQVSIGATNLFDIQSKNGQQMGATVYSEGGYFVACAPLWEFVNSDSSNSQPRGQCVYSGRSLMNFLILNPCDVSGNPTNQIHEGFCEAGFSVAVSLTDALGENMNYTNTPFLATGTPGRSYSSGGVFFYDKLNGTRMTDLPGRVQDTLIDASVGVFDDPRRNTLHTVHNVNFTYYGFAMASGFLTSKTFKDYAVSAPRYTQYTQIGRVYIINRIDTLPNIYVDGDQFGEYFGYSVAVADLNGDGWDDLLVGAPIYSRPFRNELGRVIVYMNQQGVNFTRAGILEGTANNGRFGVSIAPLGDLNNDGFGDVAVGAPFEGSGVVYIYYGQAIDQQGSIVNPTVQQRIDGSSVINQVSDLTSVSSFGFSLSGSVDVDQNEYRDLVIGAFESQVVFVLRSIPIAITNISAMANVSEVTLESYRCRYERKAITCFEVTVCSQYRGKGLENGFVATYRLSEAPEAGQEPRLFFMTSSANSITREISYSGVNTQVCDTVVVLVRNTTVFRNFNMNISLEQVSRDRSPVDTSLNATSFSQYPIIDAQVFNLEVPVVRECGPDDICTPDLVLSIPRTTYLAPNDTELSELAVGAIDRVVIGVEFNNVGENSFDPYLMFVIPRLYLYRPTVTPSSLFLNCSDTSPDNTTHASYRCENFRTPFSSTDGSINLNITLLVREGSLRGDEDNVTVSVGVRNPSVTFSMEQNIDNNDATTTLSVIASSRYVLTVIYTASEREYLGNGSSFTQNQSSTLGERIPITVDLRNEGPSQISSAVLQIYIPSFSAETGDYYYYYPAFISSLPSNVQCDTSRLNPRNYILDQMTQRRRRRSTETFTASHTLRLLTRQTSVTVDCSQSPRTGCIPITCNVTSFGIGSVVIVVTGYLDERFYSGKTSSYNLTAYAFINITDGVTTPVNSIDTGIDSIELRAMVAPAGTSSIPWYVIVAPVVAAFIFIVILSVILYCFGFFQRKKHDKTENTDFEQFVVDPFGKPGEGKGPSNGAPTTATKDAEGTNL